MESGSYHVLVCYLHNSVASGLTLVQYIFTVYINYCVSLQVDYLCTFYNKLLLLLLLRYIFVFIHNQVFNNSA